jgi:hypothetical protein
MLVFFHGCVEYNVFLCVKNLSVWQIVTLFMRHRDGNLTRTSHLLPGLKLSFGQTCMCTTRPKRPNSDVHHFDRIFRTDFRRNCPNAGQILATDEFWRGLRNAPDPGSA